MPGHPDGQNYAIWRGTIFLANVTQAISNAAPINVQGQVTNFASLAINIAGGTAGGVTATVTWFTDQTATQQTAIQSWIIPAGCQLGVIVPCLGNFVKIQITTPTAPVTTIAVAIYPDNTPVSAPSYVWENGQIGQLALSIPAGGSTIVLMPQVMSGRGHYYFVDGTSSTHLSAHVITVTQAGAISTRLASAFAPFTVFQGDFVVSGEPIGVLISNNDGAAAHLVDYALMLDGRK